MYSDLGKVRQSLANLLNNANKFTDYGKVTLTVERLLFEDTPQAIRSIYQTSKDDSAIQQTAYIVFRVSDTGIGMSPEQMRNIFDAFSQGDESSTRKYGGTGLGLAITRKFCTMLGGDIMVQSTPGQGSTFTIWLPEQMTSPEEDAEE
jgi:signal transduction histidine kinase